MKEKEHKKSMTITEEKKTHNKEEKKEVKKHTVESALDVLWNRNRRMNCKG